MKRIIVAVVAIVSLSACGGPSAAEKAAAASASASASAAAAAHAKAVAAWQACTTLTQPLMADVQAIQGQVNVGVTIANYGPVVGTAETALTQLLNKYNTGAATRGNECATLVSIPLGTAQVDYSDALSTWNSCIQNGSGDCSSGLQSKWSDADAQITKAVNGLAGLKPKS